MSRPKAEPSTCKVTDCDEPVRSLGYCSTHNGRFHRHGSPHIVLVQTPKPDTSDKPGPRRLRKGERIQDAVSTLPTGGTITLEEWKRLRSQPNADVHIVIHQMHAPGVTT